MEEEAGRCRREMRSAPPPPLSEDHILIIDDFTNSGSTLFGAVKFLGALAEKNVGERGPSFPTL